MAKELTTGVLVRQGHMEWSVLRQGKAGVELVSEGELDNQAEAGAVEELKGGAVLALPTDLMLLRVMSFPAVDDAELESMVELQVDKFSPFPVDQMVVAYEVLNRDEEEVRVLAGVARESVIDAAAAAVKKFGGAVQRVDAALLGCWKNIVDAGKLEEAGLETLVVVNGASVDVLTHEAGVLKSLSCLGEVSGLDELSVCEDIAGEVAHLLLEQDLEFGRSGRRRISLWTAEELPEFAGALRQECGADVSEKSLGMLPPSTYGVVLRALSGGGLNLTPQSWKDAESRKQAKKRLIMTAIAIFGLWGVVVVGGLGGIKIEKMRLKRLKKIDAQWAEPAKKVRHLRLQSIMVERYTDHTYSSLEILREISRMQPQGVDLTSFTYRKSDGVHIDGEADTGSLVNQFNESLNKSELFADVKPGTRTLTKRGRHRFSFDIKFPKDEL